MVFFACARTVAMWHRTGRRLAAALLTRAQDLARFPGVAADASLHVIGADEAGVGAVAGPVVAAAACITTEFGAPLPLLFDSKQLSRQQRHAAFDELVTHAGVLWHAAVVPPEVVLAQGSFVARMTALASAAEGAVKRAQAGGGGDVAPAVLVDGAEVPRVLRLRYKHVVALPKGDTVSQSIAAASIIAKVLRDNDMLRHDAAWPQYGFASHCGYFTPAHRAAVKTHGACPIHTQSQEQLASA